MEAGASQANNQVAEKGHQEYPVVAIPNAARNALVRQIHKHEIGDGIDDLRRVRGKIVIL